MLFLKSFILGLSVSAPVGPIGLLCIQRTLLKGKSAGFVTGLGAVTANIIYASIAAFGFSIVASFLLEQEFYIKLFGSIFLFYLGIKTFLKKPASSAADLEGETRFKMFLSTFFLMITNPIAIINFVAMFTGLGFNQDSSSIITAVSLIVGVFLGSSLWWLFLSFAVSIFRKKLTPHLSLINKLAGSLIILLAIWSLAK
ncbi:lysine transporter LysE [Bacillus toyonensis]|uniref:LysE family translocator n=1 Tax=Bacillus cereus group TaxID=86661 RepID=UPI000BF03E39|nr:MULTISPECIES: LysE family transporter [Bacillus cereus group]PEK06762.1 lysine transporter LysE [Bacillus toyonensis]PEM81655.1 lysine transporter LysE [Bacillus toyonensis]PGA49705.1 lysine transporter LysE [Bacillus toyonensis]PGB94358.1 lysine transporter LysE [Bacillus toyonensis]PGE36917.1 lysine transporter LysE [Bacillus toyonensis]